MSCVVTYLHVIILSVTNFKQQTEHCTKRRKGTGRHLADQSDTKKQQQVKTTDPHYNSYPETVSFTGVGHASLKSIHLIAISLVALGVVFAIIAPPGGYILLAAFILLAAGYDIVFIRKSQNPVKLELQLRMNPVQATFNERLMGEIVSGTIETDMDSPNELGYRPAPNKDLRVWIFDSESDAKIAAKRLLEYLPRDV